MRIYKEFFRYVIPSMMAFALSGIYTVADGFFVGNALGDNALAAINIAFPLTAFLQSIGTGIGIGAAIQYSICRGTKDYLRSNQYFGMAYIILILSSVIFTVLFFLFSPSILHFFGASGEIYDLAQDYIRYITYGAIFQIMGTGLVPFIRNMGSAIIAMNAMIAGFLTNILLDYLFVWYFPFGMAGAAVATAIGQGTTLLICLIFFFIKKKIPVFKFEKKGLTFAKKILKVGLSPFGMTFSPNITLILVNKSAVLYGGVSAVACYAIISYVSFVVILLLQGISDGSQPMLSLFYGGNQLKKVKKTRNLAYYFSAFIGVLCIIIAFIFRKQVGILFGASQHTIENVTETLPIFLSGYLFICISRVSTVYFYATNKNLWAYILIYSEPISLAILLLFLPNILNINGTWISIPLSQLFVMLLSIFFISKDTFTYNLKKSPEN